MELASFNVDTCYVYANIPPADAAGYRANSWDVEHWTQEVRLKVVTRGDILTVKLFDKESGKLFAECPVPNESPVQTAVEPVLDSSRYYVIKIVDAASGQHAFIGIGFRERERSSEFMAAITDHRQYLRKKELAQKMHEEYAASDTTSKVDYSLKPGEKITIRLPKEISSATSKAKTAIPQTVALPPPPSPEDEWGDFVGV